MTTIELAEYFNKLKADEQINGWAMQVPDNFWHSPCSTSGKWHKPGQTQYLHATSVSARAFMFGTCCSDIDAKGLRHLYIAGLFHDVGKMVDSGKDHDWHGYQWMLDKCPASANLILGHMGQWASIKAQQNPVMVRASEFICLHHADYSDAMEHWFI